MLKIENLDVSYGHIDALTQVNLEVAEGSVVSIIGSNGAGKTTLLNTISGIVKARNGSILYHHSRLSKNAHEIVKKGIVHVPEGRKIFAGLTVRENLIIGGFLKHRRDIHRNIDRMFELFPKLKERAAQQAGTLSGGEQQMLAICRGLMSDPSVLLLDEPSLGLAPLLVNEVFSHIQKIRDMGITILLVEQNAKKALTLCDYAYVLENGRISMEGKGSDLLCRDEINSAYLGEISSCGEV